MNAEQAMVREFHEKHGLTINDIPTLLTAADSLLRLSLNGEENGEYGEALRKDSLIKVADALGDLLYVTYGAAVAHGLDMEPIFAEIHRSNMTKPVTRRLSPGEKVSKGPGFEEPHIEECIIEQMRRSQKSGRWYKDQS